MTQLFNEFDPANAATWKARLEKDLKGITFEALSVKDRNDITIHPFYTQEDSESIVASGKEQPGWAICEQIIADDIATANLQALDALNNGASGLCFTVKNEIDLNKLLNGIELPYIYTQFKVSGFNRFEASFLQYLSSKSIDLHSLQCFISKDFIENYIAIGEWNKQTDTTLFLSQFDGLNQLCINAALYQNAGANSVSELAYTLAQLNEYLHLLDENKKIKDLKKIQITITTDTNFYEQIAKLRALRNASQLLLQQYGLNIPIHLHVETSNIYRSPFDSYSNLLRDTLAGMAGVLGGCDSLYIHAFDATLNESTAFSKRMSRNQQLVFKEESYLDKVADVAAGSYYIETLTEQLSEKAWNSFKQIEAEGGLIASLESGLLKQQLNAQAQELILEYKEGKRVLIGVNKFPNGTDMPKPSSSESLNSKGIHPILLSDSIL
jgi:methylmalonyl-CoA mutase